MKAARAKTQPLPTGALRGKPARPATSTSKRRPERRRGRSVHSSHAGGSRDVLIVGGGVMGCACAWLLAKAGFGVTVLERGVPGAEASSAAGGIIGAQAEAHGPGPMTELLFAGAARHREWSRALFEATGMDVGFRRSGLLRVAFEPDQARALVESVAWQRDRGNLRTLSARQALALEPGLGNVAGGVLYADDGRIDPPLLFKAVHIAAQRAGARFRTGAHVRGVFESGGRAGGVLLDDGTRLAADAVLVAAGSWSTLVEGTGIAEGALIPARGQMVELVSPAPLLSRVVFGPRCYIVPRDDGRSIIGSTLEFVGYQRDVTASAVRDLLSGAIELVPALAGASLGRTWSSFRPYTRDELPVLGRGKLPGLFFATGHYRTGILLAPLTAEILLALVQGSRPPLPIEAFAPARLGL